MNPTEIITTPPITSELWQRLRAFDRWCEISLVRTMPKSGSAVQAAQPRVWIATLRPLGQHIHCHAQAAQPRIDAAIEQVIEQASREWWARERSKQG